MLHPFRRTLVAVTGLLLTGPLFAACGGDETGELADEAEETTTAAAGESGNSSDRASAAVQAIPSFADADLGSLGEQIGETWSVGMAGASAMAVSEVEDAPVVLSATREGDVEVYDLDSGEQVMEPFSEHENAVTDLHVAEVGDRTVVVSVEVGLAMAWDLDTGELIGEIDLGHDYDITTITEYQDRPVFVNANKEIVVTDLETLEVVEHYAYDLGLAVAQGDVIDLDGSSILVAGNVIGGEYGVGAWDLSDGSALHEYPMYEHADRQISEFAVGYLGETVLVVSGDFGGDMVAWDVAANQEYGPSVNIDGSDIQGLAVVELGGTLVGVAGTLDRAMAFWDVASGETLLETDAPGLGFEHLAVSELDGRPVLVTAGSGQISRFWLG